MSEIAYGAYVGQVLK